MLLHAFHTHNKWATKVGACLGCTDAAPRPAHPRPTRRDAGTRQGRRRPRVRAASDRVVPRGKSRIGPTRLKSAPIRRKSALTRPKSGRLGRIGRIGLYRPKRPSQAEIQKKKKKKRCKRTVPLSLRLKIRLKKLKKKIVKDLDKLIKINIL